MSMVLKVLVVCFVSLLGVACSVVHRFAWQVAVHTHECAMLTEGVVTEGGGW